MKKEYVQFKAGPLAYFSVCFYMNSNSSCDLFICKIKDILTDFLCELESWGESAGEYIAAAPSLLTGIFRTPSYQESL